MAIIYVILGLAVLAALVALELRFAKRETISCGILLPAALMLLAVALTCVVGARSTLKDIDFMIQMLTTFLLANVPAYLLLVVFVVARKRFLERG